MVKNRQISVLMCSPDFFDVFYEINSWMHTENIVDVPLAQRQWKQLIGTYRQAGIEVSLIDPVEGIPDLVFVANGGLVLQDKVILPRFRYEQRQPETQHNRQWFEQNMPNASILMPDADFEGEGDAMFAKGVLYAGHGFRSHADSHKEIADFLGVEVRSLQLVDDRFYHLDTCFSIINSDTVAYFPPAFSEDSRAIIEESFGTVIHADEADATAFGLNMLSVGDRAFICEQAPGLQRQVRDLGMGVHSVDVSEFLKAGGGAKCLTLFLDQLHY